MSGGSGHSNEPDFLLLVKLCPGVDAKLDWDPDTLKPRRRLITY